MTFCGSDSNRDVLQLHGDYIMWKLDIVRKRDFSQASKRENELAPRSTVNAEAFFTETYDTLAALRQLFRVWLKNGTARLSNSSWLSVTIQQTFVYGRHSNTMRGKWWKNHLSPVSTTRVHGPSSRAEFTAVNSGAFFDTRQLGHQKMHSSSRAVNSARELGPWTRAVNSGSGNRA